MAWLSGWSYRKEITITGQSGAGTDYPVDLDIGDSAGGDFHLEGHCTNFPQDIEVTDNDGTTPIDYWIEDITADPLKMWVEVADDLGTNKTIYVYYGKNGATTNSSGANTFLQYHGAATADFLDSLDVSSSNVAWEGKIRSLHNNGNLIWGLSNQAQLEDDDIFLQSYGEGNLRYFGTRNEGTYTNKNEAPRLPLNTWVRGKITNDGTTVYGYIDGDEISTGGITTNLPNENLGLFFYEAQDNGEQAWSFARKYNSPEPSFSSAGSEETSLIGGAPTAVFYGPLVGPIGGPL